MYVGVSSLTLGSFCGIYHACLSLLAHIAVKEHNKHSLTLLEFWRTTMVTVAKRMHVHVSRSGQAMHAGLLRVLMCRPVLALWHMHRQTVPGMIVHSM